VRIENKFTSFNLFANCGTVFRPGPFRDLKHLSVVFSGIWQKEIKAVVTGGADVEKGKCIHSKIP
jgi:hypothetical protein